MKIETRMERGICVVEVSGSVDYGNADDFRQAVENRIQSVDVRIVLNLGNATYLDSTAIGVLIRECRLAREAGGDVRIAAVSGMLAGILRFASLNSVIRSFGSSAEAVASFV